MIVLIADAHPEIRSALRLVLEQETGFSLIAEAGNAEELWAAMAVWPPNLLLFDWDLPGSTGKFAVKALRERFPDLSIIVMSVTTSIKPSALSAGASGFIDKNNAAQEAITVLRSYQIPGAGSWE
jgi:DNA-binding NarL/FixJ family response regulator